MSQAASIAGVGTPAHLARGEDDDGFASGEPARQPRELPRVTDRVQRQQAYAGVLVVLPVLDHVVGRHIGVAAGADEGGQSDLLLHRMVQLRDTDRGGLAEQADATAAWHRTGSRVQLVATWVLISPSASGPSARIPYARARLISVRLSTGLTWLPVSRTMPWAPLCAASITTSPSWSLLTNTSARSICPFTDAMDAAVLTPRIWEVSEATPISSPRKSPPSTESAMRWTMAPGP